MSLIYPGRAVDLRAWEIIIRNRKRHIEILVNISVENVCVRAQYSMISKLPQLESHLKPFAICVLIELLKFMCGEVVCGPTKAV